MEEFKELEEMQLIEETTKVTPKKEITKKEKKEKEKKEKKPTKKSKLNNSTTRKVIIWTQDIKGIIYYIDANDNIYNPEDVLKGINNPRIIGKCEGMAENKKIVNLIDYEI
jgi:hypothetical protein